MIQNNHFPLAIYDDLNDQARFKWYAYGVTYAQPFTYKKIPPFQLIVTETGTFQNAILTRVADGWTQDITTDLQNNHNLTKVSGLPGDYAIIVNYSTDLLDTGGPAWVGVDYGDYYLSFDYNGVTYYTEVFRWCQDLSDKIKITYKHNEHFPINSGIIYYDGTYENEFFINSEVGKPEYEFNEDETIRDGIKFTIYQISNKKYKFVFYAPEYILDALRLIWMTDVITIDYQGKTYNIDSILFTPEWDENGFIAEVEAEFTTDTVLVMTGRANGFTDVYDSPDVPVVPIPENGDYNNDYNDDYNNN